MSKAKFMKLHHTTMDAWSAKFYDMPGMSDHFDRFHEMIHMRTENAAIVRKLDVDYSDKVISKAEYQSLKVEPETKLKSIKPRLRGIFGNVLMQLLLVGNQCKCYICNQPLVISGDSNRDHVFPRQMGFGLNGNMMPAHMECNSDKAHRLPRVNELESALRSYTFAQMPFYPRSHKHQIASLDPVLSGMIPRPVFNRNHPVMEIL